MKLHKGPLSLFALVLMAGTMASAATITFQKVTAEWSNPVPPVGVEVTINNGDPTSTIDWGDPVGTEQSGYEFVAKVPPTASVEVNPPLKSSWVLLGDFTHNNFPIFQPWLTSVNLGLNIKVSGGPESGFVFNYDVTHEETPNTPPCAYAGGLPCADRVTISAPGDEVFYLGTVGYILELSFVTDGNPMHPVSSFITSENQANTAEIFGRFVVIPEPGTYALMLVGLGLLALARRKKLA